MRSNVATFAFVLVILVTFDYFAMNGRILNWVAQTAEETGADWKSDIDGMIGHYLR
jgi:hypothetical protein